MKRRDSEDADQDWMHDMSTKRTCSSLSWRVLILLPCAKAMTSCVQQWITKTLVPYEFHSFLIDMCMFTRTFKHVRARICFVQRLPQAPMNTCAANEQDRISNRFGEWSKCYQQGVRSRKLACLILNVIHQHVIFLSRRNCWWLNCTCRFEKREDSESVPPKAECDGYHAQIK